MTSSSTRLMRLAQSCRWERERGGEVHTAQLCPLHLTPDWRSSCWRSFIATRFCLLHWKLLEILRRFVRKADSFQRALQHSPQAFRGAEHKSQMHLHWTPNLPPLCCAPFMPPSLAEGIIFQHFMHCRHNEVAARQTNRRIPSSESRTDRSSFRPRLFLSLHPSPCHAFTSPAFSHNIPLRAFVFPIIFARLSLFVDFYYFTWRLLCSHLLSFPFPLLSPTIDHCGRPACRAMSCSICPV